MQLTASPEQGGLVKSHPKQPPLQRFLPGRMSRLNGLDKRVLQSFGREIRVPQHTLQKQAEFVGVTFVKRGDYGCVDTRRVRRRTLGPSWIDWTMVCRGHKRPSPTALKGTMRQPPALFSDSSLFSAFSTILR